MEMSRWERTQALFHEAAERPPAERRAFLESAGGDDPDLLATVLGMLEADAAGVPLLDGGVARVAEEVLGRGPPPLPGVAQFGPYRIRELLGEGGMGVVYLAERPDLGSLVAIKVLRDAWLSPARRSRFASEQRTLAQLNHPCIARLYDAHTLADGTPWFVMEYVEGTPLTEYCASHGCSLAQRLALFRTVCEGVQYAHERGVVHRDLKPSNILVKPDGTPRLLDFGIAKQLDSIAPPDDRARTTTMLMTPAYASPEQIRGERAGAQSDVYSLGVILYELLTGRLPHELERTTAGDVMLATTREPTRPSAAARGPGAAGAEWSALGRGRWTDLDVLCLTALHPDPRRRYHSVASLMADVDRFLADRPLAARPDTVTYRLGKFMRRNRRQVAATIAGFAVFGVLAVLLGLQLSGGLSRSVSALTATRAVAVLPFENTYGDRTLEHLRLALPDELATPALGVPAATPRTATPPRNEEAYDLYLRSAGVRYDPGASNHEAVGTLERALALDSTYAPAWLALARRLYIRARFETGDSATMAYAVAATERAVALDPDFISGRARLTGARIERGELAAAYREASELVRRRPDSPEAHFVLSYVLRFAGLLEESARECATALSLDPHNFGWRSCAVALLGRDDYRGALGYLQLDAGSEFTRALTIHTLVRQGEEQQALAVGRPNMPHWKSYELLLACVARRPRAVIRELAAAVQPADDPEANYFAAAHLAYCGETSAALDLLERAIAGRYCSYPVLETDPFFSRLRAEPRFARLRVAAAACQQGFLDQIGRRR